MFALEKSKENRSAKQKSKLHRTTSFNLSSKITTQIAEIESKQKKSRRMSEKVFFIAFLRYVYCFGTPSSEVMSNGREKSQPVRTLNAKHQKMSAILK